MSHDAKASALRGKVFPPKRAPMRPILRTEREVLDRMSGTGARVKVSLPWLRFLPDRIPDPPREPVGRRTEALVLADEALWNAVQIFRFVRRAERRRP